MPPVSKLDVIVPGFFERLSDWSLKFASPPSFPIIEQILSVSDRSKTEVTGYESTLWKLLDPHYSSLKELPVGMQLSGEKSEQICCADPVHLRLDINQLTLIDKSQFPFEDAERIAFAELINEYLADFGGRFFFDKNERGFLALKKRRNITTVPLTEVAGNSIDSKMPAGEQKTFWHQLMNELQMLLYSAPFNNARAERGEPAINALWFWGTGQAQRPMQSEYDKIYSNDSFAGELAQSVGTPVHPVAQKFDPSLIAGSGQHLLALNNLLAHSQYDDYSGWQANMERLCVDWFSPLLDAVKRKQLSRVSLYPCNGACYVLKPGYQRRFWRRMKPLLSELT